MKQEIDSVLERDAEKFKAEVRSGADSLSVVSSLANALMREKIDTSEYLAKRGFPPGAH